MTATLVKHLEDHIGVIEEGWSKDASGKDAVAQVVRLRDTTSSGLSFFSTLGLSNFHLQSSRTSKAIHCELVMLARHGAGSLPGVLLQICGELAKTGKALLRGEVIGPRNELAPGSNMRALYAAVPAYFPDSFHSVQLESGVNVVFIWLVPISTEEAAFIAQEGWSAFEDLLEVKDPDLADLYRPNIL